jgi:CHAT domain-containing protein
MSQYHIDFLMELLQAIADNRGNRKVVFRLLKENLNKLDGVLVEILRKRMTFVLREVEADLAKSIALDIVNFSHLIQQFPLGNKASNMEISIAGNEVALTFYTREDFPYEWAGIQNNLGSAYRNRIRGEKAENIENGIAAYTAALTVRTREAFPQDWATTQYNLGNAYGDRIQSEKVENIEKAIAAYAAALTVYTREDFPYEWAATQHNLGNAYGNRIRGEKAENIENAIAAYTEALTVRTREAFPEDWANTQNSLGDTYRTRIRGEKAENIEKAIAACNTALTVYTRKAFPYEWAMTQNSLGNAYGDRIRGEKAVNIEKAIAAYTEALTVRTREAFPEDWANTQNSLGNVYRKTLGKSKAEKAETLEKAIAAYTAALTVYTREAFPYEWAGTQNNLGLTYGYIIRGEKAEAENIEKAIAAYTEALTVRTREAFPEDWATTQNNLGIAYDDRVLGEKAENIEKAIAAYTAALTVRTREAFPEDHVKTLLGLGTSYKNANQLTSAYNTLKSAIETVESLRSEILSGDETKRKHAEQWVLTYINMVEVCLELGKINEAIEYVERSKNRNLVELILDRDLKTIFPLEVANQLEQLQKQIASGQYEIQNRTAEDPKLLAQNLQQLRQQRQELQDRYLPVGSGFKFDQFQPTLDQRTAIIEWYITTEKIFAFVVKPNGQELTVWQSQPEDRKALLKWVSEYLEDYNKTGKNQWRDKLDERLNELSEILHLESILDQIPPYCDRLIFIPHRFLHLLPLHALSVGESYLLDRFPLGVGYAPSCQLLQQVQQRKRPDFQSLFAIQNPTGDLQFTDQEVNSILSLFPSHKVLSNSYATKAALDEATPHLQKANYLHFSCHGSFNPDSPFLLLADAIVSSIPTDADPKQYLATDHGFIDLSKCLTLGNLFERGFDLNKCRLVVLSACETGLIDFNNISDEYIGLPSGFLYAGSSSVVSSLWTVDDMSTAYLMIKFLQNLKAAFDGGEDVSVAVALNQAQHWLRNISWEDLEKWVNNLQLDSRNNRQIERSMRQMREIVAKNARSKNIDEKPFQSPYHWAGFTAIGK